MLCTVGTEPAARGACELRALGGGAEPGVFTLPIRIEHNTYEIVYLWASALGRGQQRRCRAATASAAQPSRRFCTDLFLRCDIFRCDIIHSFDLGLTVWGVIIYTKNSVVTDHSFDLGLTA